MHLARLEREVGWDAILTADGNALARQAEPGMYLEALGLLDVRADEAVVFEDSPNGVRAAKAAGIFTVAIPNSVTRDYGLEEATSSWNRLPSCRRTSYCPLQLTSRTSAVATPPTTMTSHSGARSSTAARPAPTPASRASTHERATAREGLRDDERSEDRGRHHLEQLGRRAGKLAAGDDDGTDRLQQDGAHADREDRCPRGGHVRLQPNGTAAVAAMIGIPGGVNGISTAAIAAPRHRGRDARTVGQLGREERNEERCERAVETERGRVADRLARQRADGRPSDPGDPEQAANAEQHAPSKRAVPPPESAHDSSTTSCDCAKRFSTGRGTIARR